MALAKTTAEIATEKMAAAKRLEAIAVMVFSFVWVPVRLSLRVAHYIASAVPVSKNGRILGFLDIPLDEQIFIFAKIWEIIPTFGFVNFSPFCGTSRGAASGAIAALALADIALPYMSNHGAAKGHQPPRFSLL